jgi:hypothetical protein
MDRRTRQCRRSRPASRSWTSCSASEVSRQAVDRWKDRYRFGGLEALAKMECLGLRDERSDPSDPRRIQPWNRARLVAWAAGHKPAASRLRLLDYSSLGDVFRELSSRIGAGMAPGPVNSEAASTGPGVWLNDLGGCSP